MSNCHYFSKVFRIDVFNGAFVIGLSKSTVFDKAKHSYRAVTRQKIRMIIFALILFTESCGILFTSVFIIYLSSVFCLFADYNGD